MVFIAGEIKLIMLKDWKIKSRNKILGVVRALRVPLFSLKKRSLYKDCLLRFGPQNCYYDTELTFGGTSHLLNGRNRMALHFFQTTIL